MDKIQLSTDQAPKAIGPYSQGILSGNLLFTSGQIPINPQTGNLVSGQIETQAKQVLDNISAVLASENLTMNDILKTTIYIKNMDDFAKVNEIYATYFTQPYPARSCVEVSRLPKDVLIEIEVIANKNK